MSGELSHFDWVTGECFFHKGPDAWKVSPIFHIFSSVFFATPYLFIQFLSCAPISPHFSRLHPISPHYFPIAPHFPHPPPHLKS